MKDIFDIARVLLTLHNEENGANLDVYTGEPVDLLRDIYIVGGGAASFIVSDRNINAIVAITHIWNVRNRCEEEDDDTLIAATWWDGEQTHLDECICISDKDEALGLAWDRSARYVLENKTGLMLEVPDGNLKAHT